MFRTICTLALLLIVGTAGIHAQADFSAGFPEIKGCERKINPPERWQKSLSQSAYYYSGHRRCGSITISVAPGLRTASEFAFRSPLATRYKVRNFDAWYTTPLCGTPPTGGDSLHVYFAEDAVLIVSAEPQDGTTILTFPHRADYKLLLSLTRLIKADSEKR